ncbi:MAG: hypothetical protein V1729_05385 [Candidatus Woesearchaeota archaeon]
MKVAKLLDKLEGVQTTESIMKLLGVNKQKAVYYVYRLRKAGYVKTLRSSSRARVYRISFQNRHKGTSYYDIINSVSPIQIVAPGVYKIYGRTPSPEETLIFAIKTRSVRTILAAMVLFRKIDDWFELYHLAKQNYIERQVGALYDISRKNIPKVRRMPKRFRNLTLPKEEYSFKYVIPGLRSKEYADIENTWKIYLPFNKKDFEVYR